jgi:hypothetical protein
VQPLLPWSVHKIVHRTATLLLFAAMLPAQEPQGSGPTELIVTYRCPPPRRAAFRQYMVELGMQRFARWKQEGVLKDYRLLFNWYIDVDTWEAMAVLSFPNFASVARWKEIEKASPGGLSRDALDMALPLNTYSADLLTRESTDAPQDASRVYFVVAYDLPTPAEFRDYANSYLVPQAKAAIREGILSAYTIFTNRFPGGKRWQGLLILEYKDVDSFSRRDEVMAKVRTQLRADPAWKAAEGKNKPAYEREPVISEALVPR